MMMNSSVYTATAVMLLLLARGGLCFVGPATAGPPSLSSGGKPAFSSAQAQHQSYYQQSQRTTRGSDTSTLSLFNGHGQHPPSVNNRHSSSDWLYNIRSIGKSTILKEVRNPVQAVAVWSFVVALTHRLLSKSASHGLQTIAGHMSIPGTAHSFLVSALGLLLVFRTNSAYQRFLEGRKIWENILSISRNLSRTIQLYSHEVGPERVRRIMHLLAAYPFLLRHHIRTGCLCETRPTDSTPSEYRLQLREPSLTRIETRYEGDKSSGGMTNAGDNEKEVKKAFRSKSCWVDRRNLPWTLFDRSSLSKVARSHNRPLWVCDRIGREVVSIPYEPNFTSRERLTLLGQAEKLTNAIGECERIHQTAVPLNYARHSLRSLTIWLFTLPFALVKDLGMLTPLVAAASAWLLFGVYQIGYSIEDPFQGSLRLSILCDSIRRDVLGTIGEDARSKFSNNRESAYSLDHHDWEDDNRDDSVEEGTLEPQEVEVAALAAAAASPFSPPSPTAEILADILSNPPQFALEEDNTTATTTSTTTSATTTASVKQQQEADVAVRTNANRP